MAVLVAIHIHALINNTCTTVCRGDSGGGLALPENDEEGDKYFLRGVVSTAPKSDHLCNVYAVATFTQIIKHEFFIKAALSEASVVADTQKPSIGVIEDIATDTTTSLNDPVNDPTDKPSVNPLNTGLNPVNSDVPSVIGNRFNRTDDTDVTNTTNLNSDSEENTPTEKPANKPTGRPPNLWVNDKDKPQVNTDSESFTVNMDLYSELSGQLYPNYNPNVTADVDPAVNIDVKPDVTNVLSDRYNNKTDVLDINTAITNAPPTKKPLDINELISNQDKVNNTNNKDSITPTFLPGTLVTETTTSVFKPMVSDLLPVNLDLKPDKPMTEPLGPVLPSTPSEPGTVSENADKNPMLTPDMPGSVSSVPSASETSGPIWDADQKPILTPDTAELVSLVSPASGPVHQKPDLAQGSVPHKPFTDPPGFDYIPHHHPNNPNYNDWQYWHQNWHNNPQNWNNNYHHNCHENGYDYHWHYLNWQNYYNDWQNYHKNGDYHQNWQNHHHDWQNYYSNRPNDHQNWQNYYKNAQNLQNWPNYDRNGNNEDQQNWHSDSNNGYNQRNRPVVNQNGYSDYRK